MTQPLIVVAGAGSIGVFVGGLLAAAGRRVTLLGRNSVLSPIAQNGVTLSDFSGMSCKVAPGAFTLSTDARILKDADLVLVTVKTGGTAEMASLIRSHCAPNVPIISLQNGLDAVTTLKAELPVFDVRAGMVPFNVVPKGQGGYHRASSGDIVIAAGPVSLIDLLNVPDLAVSESSEIVAVQWGKLVVNLNNALNALSGETLQTQLLNRDWRRLMADQMAEALSVLRAAGIPVQSTTPVPMSWVPFILRLPTGVFRRIAAQMLTIDPSARTSMAYDLLQGRKTEIAALQGRIVDLGGAHDMPTPINAGVMRLIQKAQAAGPAATSMTPADILRDCNTVNG